MRKKLTALCLAGLTALTPVTATAEKLTFGSGNVVIHPLNKRIITPWVEKLNAEANGALEIKLRHGQMLVNSKNYVDRITDDVVQIAWGMLVFNPGRFPKSLISSVPFISGSAEAGALAFCRMYEDGAFGDEFADFVPLFFVPFPQASVHLNGGPLTKMEDVAGKKIIVGSPAAAALITAHGGTPLSINVPDQYQALQRKTADGNVMTFTAFPPFRLDEVTSDHLTIPLGGATGMVFMGRERYDALSDEARAVLDANSGCDVTRQNGAIVDQWEADSLEYVKAKGTHTFSAMSDEDFQALKDKMSGPIFKSFAERVEGGDVLLEKWNAAMETAKEEIAASK